jgi:hypothetical protein
MSTAAGWSAQPPIIRTAPKLGSSCWAGSLADSAIECRRDPSGDAERVRFNDLAVAELEHIGFRCGHCSNSDFGQDHDDVAVSEEAFVSTLVDFSPSRISSSVLSANGRTFYAPDSAGAIKRASCSRLRISSLAKMR